MKYRFQLSTSEYIVVYDNNSIVQKDYKVKEIKILSNEYTIKFICKTINILNQKVST